MLDGLEIKSSFELMTSAVSSRLVPSWRFLGTEPPGISWLLAGFCFFGDGAAKPAPAACRLHAISIPVLSRRAWDRSATLPLRKNIAVLPSSDVLRCDVPPSRPPLPPRFVASPCGLSPVALLPMQFKLVPWSSFGSHLGYLQGLSSREVCVSPTLCYAMPCARSNRRLDTGGHLGPVLGRVGAVPADDMLCHAMSIRVHVWAGRI